ncbi:hypothetical protein AB4Y45_34190 [Paraburkholderia sp. EG287A]|uniref:hypothetical protein n=1 Tax=Paraburkholderia sp. EG287A TaxID=3237012 RepID=UPI0034D1BB31
MKKTIFAALAIAVSTAAIAQTSAYVAGASTAQTSNTSPAVTAALQSASTISDQVRSDRQEVRKAQIAGDNASAQAWQARLEADLVTLHKAESAVRAARQQDNVAQGRLHLAGKVAQ